MSDSRDWKGDAASASERLTLAQELLGGGGFEWNLQTGRIAWDSQLEALYGLEPGQFPGTISAWENFRHAEDPRRKRVRLDDESGAWNEDFQIVRTDGEVRWMRVRSRRLRGRGDAADYIVGVVRDVTEEKRTEAALRLSEQRLRLATEGAGIGTFETDFAASRVRFSPAACDLLGLPVGSERRLGESFAFAPLEHRAHLQAAFDAALDPTGDGRFEGETRIFRAGDERFVSYRGRVEFEDTPVGRAPWRALGVILDVTDRRRAESALAESEKQWRLAFEANAIGSFVADVESARVEYSPELLRLLGLAGESSKTVAEAVEMIDPVHLEELRVRFTDALAGESDGRVRLDVRLLGPPERWLAFSAQTEFRDAPGGRIPARVLGVALDITERKRGESALQDGQALFRAFVNNSAVIAWLKDEHGRYVFMSENFERRFGLGKNQFLGKTDFDIWEPELAEVYRRNDEQVLTTVSTLEVVEEAIMPSGERTWWHSAKLPFLASTGARYVAGLAVEITAERRAQAQILEADRRKDEFIAIVSHELRNPLAPLLNVAKLLEASGADQLRYCQEVITRQVDQMSHLLDDLLDVSRVTLGKLTLRRQRIQLARVVEAALEMVHPLIETRAHLLTVSLPNSPVWLDGDQTRLVQVLANLLSNAVRYSDAGRRIWVRAETDGSTVVVRVKDEGIGIAPERLPQIFDLFSSAHASRSEATGGLGIGLALARGLAELHGGRLTGHSEGPGKGSEFRLSLPAVEPPERHEAPVPSATERFQVPSRRRVLIADDLADGADSMAMVLRTAGHEVVTAYDGAQAVERARDFRPEIVVLDIGMPELDGYEACRRIRATAWGRDAVLIALTGWGDAEERRRALDAGFDHHLTKPVDPKVLQGMISSSSTTSH
jgi:PAS domain S-box-containing protein